MRRRLGTRGISFVAALVVAGPLATMVSSAAPAGAGAFPGINGVIACGSNRTGDSEIFTFNPAGTELQATNLTNNPGVSDARPRYSSDGGKIVFDKLGNLYVMDANGANVRQVTTAGGSAGSFSPDNSQIVFQSSRSGQFHVYKINVDGTNEVELTFGAAENSLPQWSPNGLKIAFSSRSVDPAADVMIMNPDGTGIVDVTNSPREDSSPYWSPDGAMLVFHSRLEDTTGEEIYRINIDGTNRVKLTNNPDAFDIFPVWSPDGSRIAWNSDRNGSGFGEIWTMSALDGSDVQRITDNPAIDQRCDWQPLTAPAPTRTITGDFAGPLTVNAGERVLITSARVVGPVTVNSGGSLSIVNSQISRGITANAPAFLSICGTSVSGPSPNQALGVSGATVSIRIGDPAAGCAGNRFAGDVNLTSNLAVTFGANAVSGNVNVNTNGPGNTVIKANTIYQALACAGNNPPPTNAGQPNTAPSKTGQCVGL